jgi:hypothetical protein
MKSEWLLCLLINLIWDLPSFLHVQWTIKYFLYFNYNRFLMDFFAFLRELRWSYSFHIIAHVSIYYQKKSSNFRKFTKLICKAIGLIHLIPFFIEILNECFLTILCMFIGKIYRLFFKKFSFHSELNSYVFTKITWKWMHFTTHLLLGNRHDNWAGYLKAIVFYSFECLIAP